jgi:hypothetical protein
MRLQVAAGALIHQLQMATADGCKPSIMSLCKRMSWPAGAVVGPTAGPVCPSGLAGLQQA